jgi:hypothetical protein
MRGAPAQRLAVWLARASDVLGVHRRERDKLDGVDLDLAGADAVAAPLFHARLLPQADRKCDVPGKNIVAQLAAEQHIQGR